MLKAVTRLVESDLARTDSIIMEMIRSSRSAPAGAAEQLLSGGKRLRPALLLLAARGKGAVAEGACELAAALEMIHAASLIHDDVVDGSDTRRGTQTINKRWNGRVSVLVGDFMLANAFSLIARHGTSDMIGRLAMVMHGMTTAELEQLSGAFDLDITEAEYISRIERKTAALIAECCRIGAVLTGGSQYASAMYRYGWKLGTAFQIIDDMLDMGSDPEVTGKPLGTDLSSGVVTLPLLRALAGPDGKRIKALLTNGFNDDGKIEELIRMIRDSDALSYCRSVAARYIEEARAELAEVSDLATREALFELCDFVLDRHH